MQVWRRVCSRSPLVASTTTRARSAVEAPVAMLRVYWTWPGAVGDDELAAGGGGVAVGDVDGDALLALGPQPVGDEGQVDLADAAALRGRGDRLELVVEELAGVEEQAADQGRLAVVDRSDGGEAQQVHDLLRRWPRREPAAGGGGLTAGGRDHTA